jgi:hypothetical protein
MDGLLDEWQGSAGLLNCRTDESADCGLLDCWIDGLMECGHSVVRGAWSVDGPAGTLAVSVREFAPLFCSGGLMLFSILSFCFIALF